MTLGTLTWVRALDHPDLLAPSTRAAIEAWAADDPTVADSVLVTQIDPDLADTAALTEAYRLPPAASANCVLVAGRREGEERVAAAVVRATTRADVNATVKRLLDVRKASFLPMDRAVEESGMEYGGITPLGLPGPLPRARRRPRRGGRPRRRADRDHRQRRCAARRSPCRAPCWRGRRASRSSTGSRWADLRTPPPGPSGDVPEM